MIKKSEISEFKDFLKGDVAPPPELSEAVLLVIRKELNPSPPLAVLKVFGFHVLGSFITLLFCPQFGISITGFGGVMSYVMQIHPALCFFTCGVMWMLMGQALSYFLLTWDEQRVIGQTRWGLGFGIMALTILVFGCLGRVDIDWWLGVWALGGLGAVSLFNIGIDLKFRRLARPNPLFLSNSSRK